MRQYLFGSFLAILIAAGAPIAAQAQMQDDTQRATQRTDNDDNGEWGWLGLLGLAGLMGLKRRERHDDLRHGHTAAR